MPQVTNLRLIRDKNNSPIGKGTLYNALVNISTSTRDRAAKLNVLENDRLKRLNRMYDRDRRHSEYLANQVLQRTQKSLQELTAYHHVLTNDYTVAQFKTMDPQFSRESAQTPRSVRRYNLETRLYYNGYGMKPFRPEIDRRIRQTDPARVTKIFKKVLLEKFQNQSNLVINRQIPHTEFYKMLDNKNKLRDYQYQRLKSKVRFDVEQTSEQVAIDGDSVELTIQQTSQDES
ncbi:uncharacterized protein LOC132555191 [Ylistrum balloti]|uniref:uncharacterized protein LOC132555191 n=1 Tax=Ylistrum balloti TaxID=509963 RepID=UPI00290597B3|nr:uncharacterized protein LOC132555191 [Ylistrum balloti]